MLSPNELSKIFNIISDDNQTFESISRSYEESFKNIDRLRIALSLCILIKDNLLNVTQRLISFYIIYLMKSKFNLDIGPFLPLIIETIQTTKCKTEQNFLFDLLNNQIDYIYSTVKNFLKDNTKNSYNKSNIILLNNLYMQYSNDKITDNKMNDYIRHFLYDRKKTDLRNIENHYNINLKNDINTEEEMSLNYFQPNYMTFCPHINNEKFIEKEPIWIMPHLKHNFNWKKNK